MSKVLNFLSANPAILDVAPGLCLSKSGETVDAWYQNLIEVEEETKAYEESHIMLRLTLSETSEGDLSAQLELVRVSIEHGDGETVTIPLDRENVMKDAYQDACCKFEVLSISVPNGYEMIFQVANLIDILEGHVTFKSAA